MACEKIQGIVLSVIKHNDRYNIITVFTKLRGRMVFLSTIGTKGSTKRRSARLLPLSVIESEIKLKGNQEIQFLGDVVPVRVWRDIYFNPSKLPIVYFISEFLGRYFRDFYPDLQTWQFVLEATEILDKCDVSTANFPIWFLIGFLDFAGIMPDFSDYEVGDVFDMRSGVPVAEFPSHKDWVSAENSEYILKLLRMNSFNFHKYIFHERQRREVLEKILRFYSIHYPGVGNLKSFEFLTEIF